MSAARVIDLQSVRAQREQRDLRDLKKAQAARQPFLWVPMFFWVPVRWG